MAKSDRLSPDKIVKRRRPFSPASRSTADTCNRSAPIEAFS
jgi:hypothetical protein